MEKKSKILQRKLREQPQQHTMTSLPLLEEKHVEEEDFDKWRVINMQYRALFKKKGEMSFEDRQVSHISNDTALEKRHQSSTKPIRTTDNKLDQQYLTNKLLQVESKQQEKIKRPALLIQSTEELLRQLPKGESLLEEAEVLLSKKNIKNEDPEENLRNTVDSIHMKYVQKMETGYIEVFNNLISEIEDYKQLNSEFEQKIRKSSMQANSEKEELEEIRKHTEKLQDLEAKKEEAYKETLMMEETISLLQRDINETINLFKEQRDKLNEDIQVFKEKVTQIDNQKVESLEYECRELYKENNELEAEIEKIEKLWKGDHEDVKRIMEEIDENNIAIKKEIKDISVSRAIVAQERENIKRKIQELEKKRLEYLKSTEKKIEKNPRNLYMYIDNILTETSRKIRMVMQGNNNLKENENIVKEKIEKQFLPPQSISEIDPNLKLIRDTIVKLKELHDNDASYLEKETISRIPTIVKSYKDIENKAIMKSLSSIARLSPIRKISPARESSLSSLAKLRDVTDKVIKPKHKRNSSGSSKGSIDITEIEERKNEHAMYLKKQTKVLNKL